MYVFVGMCVYVCYIYVCMSLIPSVGPNPFWKKRNAWLNLPLSQSKSERLAEISILPLQLNGRNRSRPWLYYICQFLTQYKTSMCVSVVSYLYIRQAVRLFTYACFCYAIYKTGKQNPEKRKVINKPPCTKLFKQFSMFTTIIFTMVKLI